MLSKNQMAGKLPGLAKSIRLRGLTATILAVFRKRNTARMFVAAARQRRCTGATGRLSSGGERRITGVMRPAGRASRHVAIDPPAGPLVRNLSFR